MSELPPPRPQSPRRLDYARSNWDGSPGCLSTFLKILLICVLVLGGLVLLVMGLCFGIIR